MAITLVMPKPGNTVESCTIVEWKVKPGDAVAKGDILCAVETDKASVEIPAEAAGTVLARLYEEWADVPVLTPFLILGDRGEDISALLAGLAGGAAGAAPVGAAQAAAGAGAAAGAAAPGAAASGGGSAVAGGAASPRARRAAADAAVDTGALAGTGPGGRVIERDVLAFAAAHPALGAAAKASGRLAGSGSGSGIGGRVLAADSGAPEAAVAPASETAAAAPIAAVRTTRLAGMRKLIATRMADSLATTAQFTLNSSAPAASIIAWRAKFKASDEALGLRAITLGDMAMYAAVKALARHPYMNAELKDGAIHEYADVHLGFAVDTPRGLMVPVVRQADRLSLAQLATRSKDLAKACLAGTIGPDDLSGGTFTVSNLGAYGVESFTPVVNAPQVAILGICSLFDRPVLKDGALALETRMGFSLTIDHQAVDGAPAARFLADFCRLVADFELAAAQ